MSVIERPDLMVFGRKDSVHSTVQMAPVAEEKKIKAVESVDKESVISEG